MDHVHSKVTYKGVGRRKKRGPFSKLRTGFSIRRMKRMKGTTTYYHSQKRQTKIDSFCCY